MMMMTSRHFEAVAQIIKEHTSYDDHLIPADIALDLADLFEQENSRFDRFRFLQACGV